MTQHDQPAAVAGWDEPEGLNPRGTVIIVPGRGERPAVYERFGRRISADAYRVRAVASPVEDPALAEKQVRSLLDGPKPVVLAGSDTGALFAVALVASGRLPEAAWAAFNPVWTRSTMEFFFPRWSSLVTSKSASLGRS